MDDLLELEAETPEVEEPEELETPEGEAEGDKPAEGEPEGEKPPVTSLFQADGKKFDPQVSAALTKIKTENPDLGKLLMRAVSRVGELDRDFPGGLTEVREMRDKVEELGGLTGIEDKLTSAAEMDGLAQQYMSADPAFIDDLIESSPEAFNALAPVVFQKFAEKSPDGFGAYIGRIVFSNMQEAGVPLLLMRLNDLVADKPAAVEALKQLNGYLGSFKELASKQLPEFKPGQAQQKPKADDLTKREEALRSKEWENERSTVQRGIVNAEYSKALAGRKPSTEEKAQISELFLARSAKAADRMFPGWQQKVQNFIKANDKAGYIRYMKTIYQRVVPEAVTSAVASTLRGKKAAPATAGARKPQQRAAAAAAPAAEGFSPVAKEPSTWEIDFTRTSPAMLRQNRAILSSGKKVTWK